MTRNIHDIERNIDQVKREAFKKYGIEPDPETYFNLEDSNGSNLTTQALHAETEEGYQEVMQEIKEIFESYALNQLEGSD